MHRRRSAFAALVWSLPACGCYAYGAQVTDRPVPATVIEVTLNDRGRVALESHIGAEILTVEGAVTAVDDTSFSLRMHRATRINGLASNWAGEPVTFRTEFVRQVRQRRFSMGRTVLLVGSATAGAVAFAATPLGGRLLGISSGPGGQDPGNPSH